MSEQLLRCSSCKSGVPEPDATIICIECGEGMVFVVNAALARIEALPNWHQEDGCKGGHDYSGALERDAVLAIMRAAAQQVRRLAAASTADQTDSTAPE